MADRIQHRRDTAARWAEVNPVLLEGEIGYVLDNPNQHKIGDGEHAWNDLPLRGFTGNIAQSFGDDENAVVSQKVVTEEINNIKEAISNSGGEGSKEVTRVEFELVKRQSEDTFKAFSELGMTEKADIDGYEIALAKKTNTAEKTKVKVPVYDTQDPSKTPVGLVDEIFVEDMSAMMEGKIEDALKGFNPEGGGGSVSVIDSLTSTSKTSALSANQGRALSDKIGNWTGNVYGNTITENINTINKALEGSAPDEVPTEGSQSTVMSGGVYNAIQDVKDRTESVENRTTVLEENLSTVSGSIFESLIDHNDRIEQNVERLTVVEANSGVNEYSLFDTAFSYSKGDILRMEDGSMIRLTADYVAGSGNPQYVPWNLVLDTERAKTPNNMGYVILRKDLSFAEQVTEEKTIYEIRYDFTIEGTVTIPAGCILRFNGGSLSDGTIISNGTIFELQLHCLKNIALTEKDGQVNYHPIDVDSALQHYVMRGFMTLNIVEDIRVSMGDVLVYNNTSDKCKFTINGNGHKITFVNSGITRHICDVVELRNVHICSEVEGKQYNWFATGLRDRFNCEVYADNCIFENLYIGGTYKSLKYNACKFINCRQIYGHNAEDADMNGELQINSSTFILGTINTSNQAAIQISYFGKLGSATITGCKFIDESEDRRNTDWVDCYSTQNLIITGCTFQTYNIGSGEAVFVNIKGHSEASASGQSSWLDTIGDTFNYIVSNNIFNIERKKAEYVDIPPLITIQNYPRLESVADEEFNSKRNAQIVNNIVRIAGKFPYPQTSLNNGDAKAVTVFSIGDGFNELIISGNTVFGDVPFKEIVVDQSTGETFSLFERIIFIGTSRYNRPIYKQRVENMVVKNNAIFAKSMAVMLIPSMVYYSNLTDEEKKEALKPVRNIFENNYVLSASYRTNFNLSTIPTAFADESNKFRGNIYISDSDGYTIGTASKQFNTLNRQDQDSSIVHAVGDCLFSDGKPKWWSGSKWVDATGAAV